MSLGVCATQLSCVLLVLVSPLIAVPCVLVSCNEELSKTKKERETDRQTDRQTGGEEERRRRIKRMKDERQ